MTSRKMSEEDKRFWAADFELEGNEPLPTRAEWIDIVDELMRTYFIGRHYI